MADYLTGTPASSQPIYTTWWDSPQRVTPPPGEKRLSVAELWATTAFRYPRLRTLLGRCGAAPAFGRANRGGGGAGVSLVLVLPTPIQPLSEFVLLVAVRLAAAPPLMASVSASEASRSAITSLSSSIRLACFFLFFMVATYGPGTCRR